MHAFIGMQSYCFEIPNQQLVISAMLLRPREAVSGSWRAVLLWLAHLLDIWEEAHFQLISIAAQHVAGCCLLFQDTGPDADLAVPIVQSLSLQHETKVRVALKTQLYTHISRKSMLASPISPVLCSLLLTSVQQCCQFQQPSVQ